MTKPTSPVCVDHENTLYEGGCVLCAISELEGALAEIAEGKGAFDRDPLKHAANCIEDMKAIASRALRLEEKP